MCKQKFFRCSMCGNLISVITDMEKPMSCCGELMQELIPNTVEAATEKHIPEVSLKERLVHAKIGSVDHPMTPEHHIEFIYLQTDNGGQLKRLCHTEKASVMFAVLNDSPVAVYAYCNLHGLWKTDIATADCKDDCTDDCDKETKEECSDDAVCSPEFPDGCK